MPKIINLYTPYIVHCRCDGLLDVNSGKMPLRNVMDVGECSLYTSYNIPLSFSEYINGELGIAPSGILFYGTEPVSSGNVYSYEAFSGKNGFIASQFIKNIDIHYIKKILYKGITLYIHLTDNSQIIITFKMPKAKDLVKLQYIINSIKHTTTNIIGIYNMLDLKHDPMYIEEPDKISNCQEQYNFSRELRDTILVMIKCHYKKGETAPIFRKCDKIYRPFLLVHQNSQILMLELCHINNLVFLTGHVLTMSFKDIYASVIHYISNKEEALSLNADIGLISVIKPKLVRKSLRYLARNHGIDMFAELLNPIFMPKKEYKEYIQKQDAQINTENIDKSVNFIDMRSVLDVWNWSSHILNMAISTKNLLGGYSFFILCTFILPSIPYTLLVSAFPILCFLVACAWDTYFKVQSKSKAPAIIFSISSIIIIILLMIWNVIDFTNI